MSQKIIVTIPCASLKFFWPSWMRDRTMAGTRIFKIYFDFWNSFCFRKLMTKEILRELSSQYAYNINTSK